MLIKRNAKLVRLAIANMLLAGILVATPNQTHSQTTSDDTLTLKRPESVDDATWQRMVSGYEIEKQGFVQLLQSLDYYRIDYAKDSMSDVIQKQRIMQEFLGMYQSATVRGMAQVDLLLNYVLMRNATSPRLTGRVIDVGPNQKVKSLREAFSKVIDGDCIRLGKGVFEFGENKKLRQANLLPTDIAIVGAGRDKTEIKMGRRGQIEFATRWRISDASINCDNSEAISLRTKGSCELRNCKIFNYNSGAGGSNAIFGSNAVIVVENCEMEGDSGRASGSGGGDAFDLRGLNLLYARKVHFENNSEVIRATFPCVFDRCTATGIKGSRNSLYSYSGGIVLRRENEMPIPRKNSIEIAYDADDLKFVKLALGTRDKLDARSEQIVDKLQLKRHPAYWIGLLRHGNGEIRDLAGKHLETMLPVTVNKPKTEAVAPNQAEVKLAIEQLGDTDFDVRQTAAERLQELGRNAEAALQEAAKSGSVEQRARAKLILDQLIEDSNLANDIECGRLLNWYEQNQDKLTWNESAGKYQLKE